jgi:DNA polymerase I-like protein with 3'-5' exonuclease and polymerase domains
MEEAENMIKSYFEAFPQLAKYYEASKQFGLKNGYVLLSPVTGKRSYVNFYEEYLETTKEIQGDEDFWNKYKKHKESNTPTFAILKEKVSKWFRKKGDIERMSLNYKVQGESAEMTKLACVLFWRFGTTMCS